MGRWGDVNRSMSLWSSSVWAYWRGDRVHSKTERMWWNLQMRLVWRVRERFRECVVKNLCVGESLESFGFVDYGHLSVVCSRVGVTSFGTIVL